LIHGYDDLNSLPLRLRGLCNIRKKRIHGVALKFHRS
jgi:hypothetical protein